MLETETYVERGGLRVGQSYWQAVNYTWPFAQLRFNKDELEVETSIFGMFSKIHRLERISIDAISIKRGLFGSGIRIEHSCLVEAPFLLFWTFRSNKVLEALIESDYPWKENFKGAEIKKGGL